MAYVEVFAAPVPNANRDAYTAHSERMAGFFKGKGALKIMECWGTHVPDGETTSFPLAVKRKSDETVVIGWIVWPDRETRDTAFAAMREDTELRAEMGDMPFDGKRMIFGGFEPIVEL